MSKESTGRRSTRRIYVVEAVWTIQSISTDGRSTSVDTPLSVTQGYGSYWRDGLLVEILANKARQYKI
jgi:hypothetical protein